MVMRSTAKRQSKALHVLHKAFGLVKTTHIGAVTTQICAVTERIVFPRATGIMSADRKNSMQLWILVPIIAGY